MTDQERLNYWWNRAILAERAIDRIDKTLEKAVDADDVIGDVQGVLNDYYA